jgi:membrane-associated protease RseP (regulator of RpoE activity)
VRVKDPFDEIDVAKRKAVLITACLIASAVLSALVWPTITAVIAIIVAFFVMIMFHEFGHFTMAKRADMKVTEFFVGFGPRLWSVTRGETEYGLKAIPLGGYCKVVGMTNLDEVDPEDEPRTYRAKRWAPKVVMAAAGPATHFIIAIVMMFVVLLIAGDLRDTRATLTLSETTQGAAAAGLQAGDELIAINGTQVSEWQEVRELISPVDNPAKAGDVAQIVIRRGDQVMTVPVTLNASVEDPNRVVAGVAPTIYTPQPGVLESAAMAPREVGQIGWESVKALGGMFSPSGISNYFRILSGDTSEETDQSQRFVSPIGLGSLAHDAVQAGWVTVFGLLISINIFVGLFNLVPLLPFDGGHIAVATYEQVASKVKRRKVQVDINKLMPITVAVLTVLAFIFVSSVFLDITNPVNNPF